MKIQTLFLVKKWLRATQIGFLFASLTFGAYIHAAPATTWSGAPTISPDVLPDPWITVE